MATDPDGEAVRRLRSVGGAQAQDQLGMDETRTIDDASLEEMLNDRLRAGDDKREVTTVYKRANEAVQDKLATLGLGDGEVVRIGRFRITRKAPGESQHREFDTNPKARMVIELWPG